MKMFRIIPMALLTFFSVHSYAVTLRWDIPKGERLEMTRTAAVKFLLNERTEKIFQERNIIDLTCVDKKGAVSAVKGRFSVYERGSVEEVFQMREQHPSEFDVDELGRFNVPKKFIMPNLRNLPTFPERDIVKGEKWTADAHLVLNSFSVPFKLTFPAEYHLVEIEKSGDVETAVIKYVFTINMDLPGGKYPPDFPSKIIGKNEGSIRWDITNRRPAGIKEKYRIVFYLPSGQKKATTNEFQMLIDTSIKMYRPVSPEQKEREKQALKKEIPDGVDVDTDTRGLVIRLGDVLFDFDSAELRSDSREKLDAIAVILKKEYVDREIIVEGHTDNTGGTVYNRRLSVDRAVSVARYLRPKSVSEKLSYRGFGADKPIADNGTKSGRQKNRRVEIIIKLQ